MNQESAIWKGFLTDLVEALENAWTASKEDAEDAFRRLDIAYLQAR